MARNKIIKEPIDLGDKVKLIGSDYYSALLSSNKWKTKDQGVFRAIYYGDTDCGTHKGPLSDRMLKYARRKRHHYVADISSGSRTTADMMNILEKYPDMQHFQIVSPDKLENGDRKKGYSIEHLVRDESAPFMVKIATDMSERLYPDDISKIVSGTIKGSRELKNALKKRPIPWSKRKVIDVTNPHDWIKGEAMYNYDPDFLAQFDFVLSNEGTGNGAYALQESINKIPVKDRPTHLITTNQGHPSVQAKGDNPSFDFSNAQKTTTPYDNTTLDLLRESIGDSPTFFYTPSEDELLASHGRVQNMADKAQYYPHRFRKVHGKEVWKEEGFWRKKQIFDGFEYLAGEDIYPRLCNTGSMPLTALTEAHKENAMAASLDGLYIPRRVYANMNNPEQTDLFIPAGSKVLAILTGKSKDYAVKELAQKLYED